MLALRRPSPARLEHDSVGLRALTRTDQDPGSERSRVEAIGWGLKRFERAVHALRRLEQFNLAATELSPPIRAAEGARTMIVGRRMGLWTIGPMEVTSVVETETSMVIEIATLEGHPLSGTERFELVRHPNGIVRMGIHASSRPAVWWAWLALPIVRGSQRAYRRHALDHLRRVTGRPSIDR